MANESKQVVNDKTYPISWRWLLKPLLGTFVGAGIVSFFVIIAFTFFTFGNQDVNGPFNGGILVFIIFFFSLVGPFFSMIFAFVRRLTFDYTFEDNFIVMHQGLISRSQRNIPYSVLQNVIVKQDLSDRILGITTFIVENAVQDFSAMARNKGGRRYEMSMIGFSGNKVVIPGLTNDLAQSLKEIVLAKMKSNQAHSSKTGGL